MIAELGRGAETVVYHARRGSEDFAVKLFTGVSADPARALASVRREAAVMGCVGHPLLPRIFEVGQVEAGPYLVLEYIDGCPLSQRLGATRLDEAQALQLAIDIVGPLAAAHRVGLVHRDVKPDNVIVGTGGAARLIDFGLVARGGARNDRVAGTLLYSAPEQTGMLKRPVDGRSDLYALGVLLFESVTGQTPYTSRDAGELIRLHATAPIPDPRSLRPELSPTFAAIVRRLMAKDPDDRYQSGDSLLADLQRLHAEPGAEFEVGTRAGEPQRIGPNVLVGRADEVTDLALRWLKARDGAGGAVLVEGLAGVGKSRLVREVTTAVASDGDLVMYAKCVPDDPVPLAPLRAAVERLMRSIEKLPPDERDLAIGRLRRAAGQGGPLLRALSPMLASLVQAPELGQRDRHEQFTSAVAAFLLDLAEEWQGALLHIDDVQWLDSASRRVLQQMATRLPQVPMLVVGTARDDVDNLPALARFGADMAGTLDTTIPLGPLDSDEIADLISLHLGGVDVPPSVTDDLVVRIGGNPFTVIEYVRAIVDAGLITPAWGGWRLDLAALDQLELSGDALNLVIQRIGGLGVESRRLLAAGAAMGRRFRVDLVARVSGVNSRQARHALAEAEARLLVTSSREERYAFLHDRIREALLAELPAGALRQLHQRIAEVLEAVDTADPRRVYATARHYALGEFDRTPERVYASGFAAGRLALEDHAPAAALEFLEVAADGAEIAGLVPDADFHRARGLSCARTGRFAEAIEHLDRALRDEKDELRRADVLAEIARVHTNSWDPGRALDAVSRGLAQLGRPLPSNRVALAVTSLGWFFAGLAVGLTRIGFGRARRRCRERYRLQAFFYDIAGTAAALRMDLKMRAIMSFRALYVINRLGHGVAYARHLAGFGLVANYARRHRLARLIFDRTAAIAADTGDPVVIAHVEWKRGAGSSIGAADDGQLWERAIDTHERWLELGEFLTGVSGACVRLVQRGRTLDAQAWYARGKTRLGAGALAEGAGFAAAAAIIPAQLGRPDEATAAIEALRRFLTLNPGNMTQLVNLFAARILALVERGELGEPFEQVIVEFEELGLRPASLLSEQRTFYIYETLGRLAQCHEASREQRARYRVAAERAAKRLGRAANNRTLRAYHLVARADLTLLAGRPEAALRDLALADTEVICLHAPLIAYEMLRVRARALRALGEPVQAAQQARYALMIAIEQQWALRARWVRTEFGIADYAVGTTTGGSVATTGAGSSSGGARSGASHGAGSSAGDDPPRTGSSGYAADSRGSADALSRRRLAALQQVSLASATVLDPRELARVALYETVRILGAERAFLFLLDADRDHLVPQVGVDGDGNDIEELTAYSTTLVERVRVTGEPVVVTGSEEGVALGSRSAQTHGLRSIMVAPLLFDARLLGVVYLDSRVAKGMFTTDDVDILTAITNHVATSLETARAAQLAVAVEAAQRQRDVAEMLREAMADQSATLDPDEVMRRLLRALSRTLGGNAAALLTRDDGDSFVVTASHGGAAGIGTVLDSARAWSVLSNLSGTLVETVPDGQPQPFGDVLGPSRSWLGIPVAERGEPLGVLLVAGNHELTQDGAVELAAALAGQGMTAFENARLFSEVRRLATIDGLTGLYTRNHFFAEADRQLRVARRYQRPVAAIMLDIDHFKRINDTYGHPVGDEVIRVVAERLREAARDSDVVGRYGGEEFAVLTPETGGPAARLAERLREVVGREPVPTDAGPLPVTISVGIAHLDSGGEQLRELLARADAALYEAKQNGRNRVAVARPAA
ncbi:MAG TPA: diguanylate cyclase [Pilimelia sp.]|nr:diguanylate cyclase [Pilimelia sp.]